MTSPPAAAFPHALPHRPPTRRIWLALILLGAAAAVLARLGLWQLTRADERRAIAHAIAAGRSLPPLTLAATTPADALQPWRAAQACGHWRNDLTVLIENRNLNGRAGFWVATPLQQQDGTAVLVLRGWLARPFDADPIVPAGAPGEQHIAGELARHVPSLYELPSLRTAAPTTTLPPDWPAAASIPRVQNLPLDALARATGLNLLPAVLMQTASTDEGDDSLVRDWPQPSLDADKNIGYALQWFAFAAIAAGAWAVVLVRALRRRGTP